MKKQVRKIPKANTNIHPIFVTKKNISKIGISGLKNLIIIEKIITKILEEKTQEKYGIKKIVQINFLNKNIGRLFTIFIFQSENQEPMNSFFNNFGIHFFTVKKDFSKIIDSRDFIFLKEKTIYKKNCAS